MDTNRIEKIFNESKQISGGHLASYIPELTKVDSRLFAVAITDVNGQQFYYGDSNHEFTLQSTSKPFVYTLALEKLGENHVLQHVGVEPTGEAFDSIIELEKSTHRPYNPMINSGAIAITNHLANYYYNITEASTQFVKSTTTESTISQLSAKTLNPTIETQACLQDLGQVELQQCLNNFAGSKLNINWDVFQSEQKTANRNKAIAYLLKNFGVVPFDIEKGLDLYFKQCSVTANVKDLSMMASTLANGGVNPKTQLRVIKTENAAKAMSLMMTCGMYDTAGDWAYKVGVPAKSGVSGAIFAVVPGVLGIAAFSPLINKNGHSMRGYHFIEKLVHELKLSIFNGKNNI